ncbi:MAG TPA: bifunctional isocitrate dehydrogenase kinase/phosphatase [Gemmatimonadales bacterium]|nr:bifunctional isocitrate dehydrogenase kinase/phosphatase [Gemmatimonadales bacterium]
MPPSAISALIDGAAEAIVQGFDTYHAAFLDVTRRAGRRFADADWHGLQADVLERLDLYEATVLGVVERVRRLLGERVEDVSLWTVLRGAHSQMIVGHPAAELAETFFNSVTRRVFRTVGINAAIEYLDFQFERVAQPLAVQPWRTFVVTGAVEPAVRALFADYRAVLPLARPERDAAGVSREIERAWQEGGAPFTIEDLELLEPVFFRRKAAYLVGRARGGNRVMPLVLAIVHGPDGVEVDAALLAESDVSVVFSFTRSYFHADVPRPAEVTEFLRSLMPVKPLSELYNALGHNKHGKTELYREVRRHLARTDERFEQAAGARGTVMAVFTLPSFDVVFKVIRDQFEPPKQTTPEEVKRRYHLVFAHDRAGRLVDAHSFEGLVFPRARFSRKLLAELQETAGRSVRVEGDTVVVRHAYTERRVRPLDLHLMHADEERAQQAVLDYGQSIRDLAATGIFPGDLLLKNFGVTRHGRVVFYDYDELRLLSECAFREVPVARHPEDELDAEPWFHVAPNDVFPEELGRFLPFDGALREAYLAAHGELYTVDFWRDIQDRHAAGEVVDIFPYPEERRLGRTTG